MTRDKKSKSLWDVLWEDAWNLGIGLVLGALIFACSLWKSHGVEAFNGLASVVIGIVAGAYIKDLYLRRDSHRELTRLACEEIRGSFDKLRGEFVHTQRRLDEMFEHAAFFTDTNNLENQLELLKRTQGKLAWIVAKFISRQISDSFRNRWLVQVNSNEYSDFAARLYHECDRSLCLTSPFTPRKWFELLLKPAQVNRVKSGGQLTPKEVPPHAQAALASPAPKKRRLIALDDDGWKDVTCDHPAGDPHSANCAEKANLLREFLRINGADDPENPKMGMRFIRAHDLTKTVDTYRLDSDYAIFDEQLTLTWERPQDGDEKKRKPLTLSGETGPLERQLIQMFEFSCPHKFLHSGQELLEQLTGADGLGPAAPDTIAGK